MADVSPVVKASLNLCALRRLPHITQRDHWKCLPERQPVVAIDGHAEAKAFLVHTQTHECTKDMAMHDIVT
jgi:hypothetical protein